MHQSILILISAEVELKTSRRIFAKAINYEEISNNPQIGSDIDDGKSLDVIEIDAASNNGVDQIREVIDISQYSS